MKINIRTNISESYGEDVEIVINTSLNNTKEVSKIVETLQQITNEVDVIIGRKGNEISVINVNEIVSFYSNEQNNYCKTQKGDFLIKQKLYELEGILPKNKFIRISNSTIINIQFVECFDVSMIGNIIVKMKNGTVEHVSKRRVSRSYEISERKREEIIMKKVLRNIFKSVAITSLVIQITMVLFLSAFYIAVIKTGNDDPQVFTSLGESLRKENEDFNEDNLNKSLGIGMYAVPIMARFETAATALIASIIIGTIIGVVKSIDEKSKKKLIITYFAMYTVMFLVFCLYELIAYRNDPISKETILGLGLEGFVIYTVIYVWTFLAKKIDNNKKVKLMNKELKEEE